MNSTFYEHKHKSEPEQNMEVRVVAALIRDKNGDVLLTQRDPGRTQSPTFEFPGGKVEEDEDDETALLRELKEELNVLVQVKKPAVFQTENRLGGRKVKLLIYRCVLKDGSAPIAKDVKGFEWVPTTKILEKKIPEASMAFVRELHQGRVSELDESADDGDFEKEVPAAKVLRFIDVSKFVSTEKK